jgi:hypothetical protein
VSEVLVFNHHSLPFGDRAEAAGAVPDFLRICLGAHAMGFSILLDESQDPTWFGVELAPDFHWRDWHALNSDDPKAKDQISAFRSILTRSPLFDAEEAGGELELFDVTDASSGKAYPALRAAAWYESPMVSFPNGAHWNLNPLKIHIDSLSEGTGDIVRREGEIANFHDLREWEEARPAYEARRSAEIDNGTELWAFRKAVYPMLDFCGRTESQFSDWSHPLNILDQVKESFGELNEFCGKWRDGGFPDYSHNRLKEGGLNRKVSGESDSVDDNPGLRRHRMFYLPDGRCEYFEFHIKLSQGYRIHFFPDQETKTIWIGYVGPHLPL